jgi:hypothetical protein
VRSVRYALIAAALVVTAAGCGSSTPKSGTEVFTSKPLTYAQLMSNNTVFQLDYTGPVKATGTFNTSAGPPAPGQHHTFKTSAGNIYAVVTSVPINTGAGNAPAVINAAACRYGGHTVVHFRVTGGTSNFKNAKGTGTVNSNFGFTVAKLKSGKCNLSQNSPPLHTPAPTGSFDGSMNLSKV